MKIANYWRAIGWFLIMCYLLFIPARQIPSQPFFDIPHFDKIIHFGMFFIMCILMFRPVKPLTPNFYFWSPLATLVLAVALEFLQQKISSTRHTDIYDLVANTAGLLTATVVYRYFIFGKKLEKLV